jgi:putative selenate reductase
MKYALVRDMKKLAVINAQGKYIENIKMKKIKSDKKVVVIGAGPAGMAAALFLRRNGVDVTVLDRKEKPYGIIEYVIPEFRISSEMINKDFELVKKQGVKFQFEIDENFSIEELKKQYDYIVLAIGAWKPGKLSLKEGSEKAVNAVSFLENYKRHNGDIILGKNIYIIGGGDVAMDAARATKRVVGVENVSIIYRRTKEYMPADREEIELALSDGVLFKELISPTTIKDGKLVCEEMNLGERDTTCRRNTVSNGKTFMLDEDTVIVAVGEKIDSELLVRNGIELDSKGFPKINDTCETNIRNVYVAGDVKKGPATIVKGIADGKVVAKNILEKEGLKNDFEKKAITIHENQIYERKGILTDSVKDENKANRYLSCNNICELCVDVCPNRANVVINIEGNFVSSHQIIQLDGMCNESENCGIFCPYKKTILTIIWYLV